VSVSYERRLGRADTPERAPLAGASLGCDVVLALPPGDPSTEAAQRRSAGITVTDYILRHGCRGPGCKRGHKAHVAAVMDALMALDLVGDADGNQRSKWRYGQAPKTAEEGGSEDVAGQRTVQGPP
jgi:hypothetical protein